MNRNKHKSLTVRLPNSRLVMKFHQTITISLVILLITLLLMAQATSNQISTLIIENSGKIALITPLHVEGRYIKNEFGEIVVLRGINKAGFEDFAEGWWNPEGGGIHTGAGVWDEKSVLYNLQKIKEWGANVVRFHHSMDFWVRQDLYPNFRQRVRQVTEIAGKLGLYVIWDPFSVIKGGPQRKFPWYPYVSNETNPELGYSEKDIMPNSTAFVEYWRQWAEWLKDYPNVLFEIYNEPKVSIDEYWGWYPDKPDWQEWVSVVNQCIQAIRSTGAKQPIIVAGNVDVWVNLDFPKAANTMWWVSQVQEDGPTPIIDPLNNIIYCTHQYRASQGLGFYNNFSNAYTYQEVWKAMNYTKIFDVINKWDKPLIITECGPHLWHTGEELIKEIEGLSNQLRIYNQYGISYLVWVWTVPSHMPGGILALTEGKWYCEPNVGGRVVQQYLKAPTGEDIPIYIHPTFQYAGTGADYKNIQYRETGKPYLTTWITQAPTRTLVENINFDGATMTLTLHSMRSGTQTIEIVCGTYGEPMTIINATKISYDQSSSKLKVEILFNGNKVSVMLSWTT